MPATPGSNAEISLMLCSSTAMKRTMLNDVMVTAVLVGASTQCVTGIGYSLEC